MIILDTNVVSEPLKPNANPAVLDWLDRQVAETLFLTSTSLAELLVGVGRLPLGKRKAGLDQALEALLADLFGGRVLAFDRSAAVRFAALISRASQRGSSVSVADGQIAAIASVNGFSVATRDVRPYLALELPVINPWEGLGS